MSLGAKIVNDWTILKFGPIRLLRNVCELDNVTSKMNLQSKSIILMNFLKIILSFNCKLVKS